MLSNINSPFYFSGQESGKTDQWALIDLDNNILLVDQNLKLIKFLQLVMKERLRLVEISKVPNYTPIDNSKCLILCVRDDRIAIQKATEIKVTLQQKLMYIRSIIEFVMQDIEFFDQFKADEYQSARNLVQVEQEYFDWLRPGDINIQKLYEAELELFYSHRIEITKIKQAILEILLDLDIEKSLPIQFINKINTIQLVSRYFDYYLKSKLNELYGTI